jgi:hypothetical protein
MLCSAPYPNRSVSLHDEREKEIAMDSLQKANTGRREYRLTTFQKGVYWIYGSMSFVGSGFFVKLAINPFGRDFALVVIALLLGLGLYLILLSLRSRLILDGSRIEVRYAFKEFAADRNEIEGIRTIENRQGIRKQVCLKDGRGRFNVLDAFACSNDLSDWFKGLLDLDQRDSAELLEQINHQENLGATAEERVGMLTKAQTWNIGLSVTAGLVSMLALVNYLPTHSIAILLLTILPAVASMLLLRFPLLYTLFKGKADPRTDLLQVLCLPSLGILMCNSFSNDTAQLVNFSQPVGWVLLVLFLYLAVPFSVVWKLPARWAAFFFLFILGLMYSVGVVRNLNILADRSPASIYHPAVMKKYESHGKGTTFYLRLTAWGPFDNPYDTDVPVPQSFYNNTRVGDQLCTYLYPGLLHLPWYRVDACPTSITLPQLTAPVR